MERKEIFEFCKNFAHEFISSECMMKEFANMKCREAQEVAIHLENHLDIALRDWLEEKGVEIED